MNYKSDKQSRSGIGIKTAIAGSMIFILLFGFTAHLDFAAAQISNNTASPNSTTNSCAVTAKQTYQSALQSAKTARDSAIQQIKQTDQTSEKQFRADYQQAAQAAQSLYKTQQQANLTAAKSNLTAAQQTLKTALTTDKGDPTKIAADRVQHANTVDATYAHYYLTIYQEASERAHTIWSAAATRDANIEGVRETMWTNIGQAYAAYYGTINGLEVTYDDALAACKSQTTSTAGTG
ncbi:hypothetical protein [Candidatus Nitrosotalea bavarica]|uniref:hypothetical protein n=1 Tax=Candidatus Nitrosotalea bavarica TaxID=1903277 RepID=UPI000C705A60|nr:hypothetical protein [Candidatus Nitrosotalea bavarica]